MSIDFMRPEVDELRPRISVIGVGGAGGNAIANMMRADVQGVDFVVANTDAQALNASLADRRIQLGLKITQGLGAGSRPEIGRAAAEETIDEIITALEGAHMCFIAAGMGGGTGTGAAPVIAKAARDRGILTVGVVTKPFAFEGARRMRSAEAGIDELQKHVERLLHSGFRQTHVDAVLQHDVPPPFGDQDRSLKLLADRGIFVERRQEALGPGLSPDADHQR